MKRREVNSYQDILIKRGLSLFISPLILTPADLEVLNPLYFEIADYGIVLFQRGSTVSEFLDKIAKIKHKRKNTKSGDCSEMVFMRVNRIIQPYIVRLSYILILFDGFLS